jgi:hypothetical protein
MADVNTDQTLPFTLTPLKPDGTPGAVDTASVVYASSDETVLTVGNLSADKMSGDVGTVAAGVARITVTADADLGDGVKPITGVSEDVNVTTGPLSMASTFSFTFGPPVDKVTPTPPPGP